MRPPSNPIRVAKFIDVCFPLVFGTGIVFAAGADGGGAGFGVGLEVVEGEFEEEGGVEVDVVVFYLAVTDSILCAVAAGAVTGCEGCVVVFDVWGSRKAAWKVAGGDLIFSRDFHREGEGEQQD